jgi:hypothetical protein
MSAQGSFSLTGKLSRVDIITAGLSKFQVMQQGQWSASPEEKEHIDVQEYAVFGPKFQDARDDGAHGLWLWACDCNQGHDEYT